MPTLEVQMRCEDGELLFVGTIKEAMRRAENDPSIWKISWTDGTTGERIRLVKFNHNMWFYQPIVV